MSNKSESSGSLSERFREDGVVHIAQALTQETMRVAETAFQWSMNNPGPGASSFAPAGSGEFSQDLANPASFEAYAELLAEADIANPIREVWSKPDVWFMYEQVFRKAGGKTRRTPWHQDTSYLPIEGDDVAVMWISFEGLTNQQSLEFVLGSHRGTLYDGSKFDPKDDTAPLYGDGSMPRLPDIEADRSKWPIVSYAIEPGDVVIFHPATLHGGAATHLGLDRRTLSLRFFGEDAMVVHRPGGPINSRDPAATHPVNLMGSKPAGSPFRDARFPKLL